MEAEFARGPKSAVGGLKRYICVDLCLFAVVFGLRGRKPDRNGSGRAENGDFDRKWTQMDANEAGKREFQQENRKWAGKQEGEFSEIRGPRSEVRGRGGGEDGGTTTKCTKHAKMGAGKRGWAGGKRWTTTDGHEWTRRGGAATKEAGHEKHKKPQKGEP